MLLIIIFGTLSLPILRRKAACEWVLISGSASAVKEPGHFEVGKSSSQVRSPRVPDAAKGSPDPVA